MPREPIDVNAMSGSLKANPDLVLERLRFATQQVIGKDFAEDTRINIVSDVLTRSYIAQIETTILANKLADDTYHDSVQTPASAFQHFKLDYSWRWTVWYLAWLCWIVRRVARRWPVRYVTHTLEVRVRDYDLYPHSRISPRDAEIVGIGLPYRWPSVDVNRKTEGPA